MEPAPKRAPQTGTQPVSDIRELRPAEVEQATVPTVAPSLSMIAYGATDRGRVRSNNEDQFLLATLTSTLWIEQSSFPQARVQCGEPRGHLLLVADGMGGHAAGEQASKLAVGAVESFTLGALTWLLELKGQDAGVLEELKGAIKRADAMVTAKAAAEPELHAMGTTLTLAYFIGEVLYVAHAGDSRCYLWRSGQLHQITRDHTIVGELISAGALEPERAPDSALRHMVTNVVGGGLPGVSAEVHKIPLLANDVILLCSDGLTEMVSDERLAGILWEERDPQRATERLIREANEAGGVDNITAVVARFDAPDLEPSFQAPPPPNFG